MMKKRAIVRFTFGGKEHDGVVASVDDFAQSVVVHVLVDDGMYGANLPTYVDPMLRQLRLVTFNVRDAVTVPIARCVLIETYAVVPITYFTTSGYLQPVPGLSLVRAITTFRDSSGATQDVDKYSTGELPISLLGHCPFEGIFGRKTLTTQRALKRHLFAQNFNRAFRKQLSSQNSQGINSINVDVEGVDGELFMHVLEAIEKHAHHPIIELKETARAEKNITVEGTDELFAQTCVQPYWIVTIAQPRDLGFDTVGTLWHTAPFKPASAVCDEVRFVLDAEQGGRIVIKFIPLANKLSVFARVSKKKVFQEKALEPSPPLPAKREILSADEGGIVLWTCTLYVKLVAGVIIDVAMIVHERICWQVSIKSADANLQHRMLLVVSGANFLSPSVLIAACGDKDIASTLDCHVMSPMDFHRDYYIPAHPLEGVLNIHPTAGPRMILFADVSTIQDAPTCRVAKCLCAAVDTTTWEDLLLSDISAYSGYYSSEVLRDVGSALMLDALPAGAGGVVLHTSSSFIARLSATMARVYPASPINVRNVQRNRKRASVV
jgi:hypothetical protein